MSNRPGYGGWGPSHQQGQLARRPRRWLWILASWLLAVGLMQTGSLTGAVGYVLHSTGWLLLLTGGCWAAWKAIRAGHLAWLAPLTRRLYHRQQERRKLARRPAGESVRGRMLRLGGGAYLGQREHGSWVVADPEHAVLVLGPPRSGKSSCVVIPAILAAPGPVLATSTKPDVIDATWRARTKLGQCWLYDPTGSSTRLPVGVRRLRWSPVSAATSWDGALLTARAMVMAANTSAGTSHADHWRERSAALLAPLLYAAQLSGQSIATVLSWVLRGELDQPAKTLEDHDAQNACDVLAGIARTEARERSSIFSATAGTLAAYNSDAARASAKDTNFDPTTFPASSQTIYITAPAHHQALCAPLIVALIEQIRHATYQHATTDIAHQLPPVLLCLDEIANIAPISDLQALLSQAGGQRLHILACLQDLSQARTRWGKDTADGLLTLFQTKLILAGIADTHTLQSISLALGEYDRQLATNTHGRADQHSILRPDTHSETISHTTQRQRILSPGEIAHLPPHRALLIEGVDWQLIHTTPWYRTHPWPAVAGTDASEHPRHTPQRLR